jgi:hypothetical protein
LAEVLILTDCECFDLHVYFYGTVSSLLAAKIGITKRIVTKLDAHFFVDVRNFFFWKKKSKEPAFITGVSIFFHVLLQQFSS